jgi:TonB-dependent starch-binding outer membrane protein SusC
LIEGLKFVANLGYNRVTSGQQVAQPYSSFPPNGLTTSGSASFYNSAYETINLEPQLDYKLETGRGKLTALLGGTFRDENQNTSLLSGTNYVSDAFINSINGAGTITGQTTSLPYKYAAAFARVGYTYDNKYILTVNGRRDGSSNFGPGRQFGNFGAAAVGWIFSNEDFIKNMVPFLSFGKLTGSYGTNGTDGVQPYSFQSFWQSSNQPNQHFQGVPTIHPYNLYNPDYSWAIKRSVNIGLDLGFFQDRLVLNATWYQNQESDQLIAANLPYQTGFNSIIKNFEATIQNAGFEFTVSSVNIKSKDFSWTTNLNMSLNRNKLISFPGLATSAYAQYYTIGKSVNTVVGYRYKGVNETTGLFEFYNAKGEATSNPNYGTASSGGDQVPIADLQPKCYGGITNTFRYKGFSLTAVFIFYVQDAQTYLASFYGSGAPGFDKNLPVEMLNQFWSNVGDKAKLQRLTSTYGPTYQAANAFGQSSGVYGDASYIRLKNVAFSYSFPSSYLTKLGMSDCRLFIDAQNLFTITGYQVGDPAMPGQIAAIPIQRSITGGISINF